MSETIKRRKLKNPILHKLRTSILHTGKKVEVTEEVLKKLALAREASQSFFLSKRHEDKE